LEAKALAGELATVDAEEVEEAATAPMPALAVESEVEGRLVDALREASVARRETASGADIVVGEAGEGRWGAARQELGGEWWRREREEERPLLARLDRRSLR
jgi:hypothetical protein